MLPCNISEGLKLCLRDNSLDLAYNHVITHSLLAIEVPTGDLIIYKTHKCTHIKTHRIIAASLMERYECSCKL